MTSTTSSKKKSGFSSAFGVFKWSLKRNIAIMTVYTLLLFISMPMTFIINVFKNNVDTDLPYLVRNTVGTAFSVVVIIFSAISALMAFSYLHNKRSVDMFGALPISRRNLFFSRYAVNLFSTLVPMLLITALSLFFLDGNMEAIQALLTYILYLTIAVIANTAMIALIAVCAGSVIDVIVSYFTICAVYPLTVLVLYYEPTFIIPGFIWGEISSILFTALSPVCASFVSIFSTSYDNIAVYELWWVLFAAVCLILSFVLIKKRKNETAQSRFAFSAPQIIIRFFTDCIAGFGFGLLCVNLLGASSNNTVQLIWFSIGAVIGAFAAHILLHVIYNHSLKRFVRTLVYYAVSAILVISFMFSTCYGMFNQDVYVPDTSDIQTLSFDITVSGGNHNVFLGETLTVAAETEKEITQFENIHTEISNTLRTSNNYPYNITKTSLFNEDYAAKEPNPTALNYYNIDFVYTLKDGKAVKRNYSSVSDTNVINAINEVLLDKNYVKQALPLFVENMNDCRDVNATLVPYSYSVKDGNITYERYPSTSAQDELVVLQEALESSDNLREDLILSLRQDILENDILAGIYQLDNSNILQLRFGYEDSMTSYSNNFNIGILSKNTIRCLHNYGIDVSTLLDYSAEGFYYDGDKFIRESSYY